jgi:hypothetical protein
MADVSTFMAEGVAIPQGSALTDITKQTVMPEWYTNYAMDVLAGQKAISSRPYETAPMPRVADFTEAQKKSFGMTETAAGAYQPMLNAATTATQGAMAAPGSLATSQPYFNQAINMNGVTAATPGLQQGAQFTAQSTNALGMNAAQPYLQQAGQSSVANIGQYMNPYNEAVTNRIGELGARNLTENLLPAIEGRYIQAGQLGFGGRGGLGGTPSGMMTETARTLRDVNADILAQQTAALQSGYTQAAGLAGTDLGRQGQLAQTAGSLGTQQQGALAQAGQQMANIGQTYGTLTGAQQRAITDIGANVGTFAGQDISRTLQGAQQLAGMGEDAQRLGLTGAGALQQVGALQQQQGQKNLDVAYSDFLRQQGYEQEQIDQMLKTFQGVATGIPTATQEYGVSPSSVKQEYPASTASNIASGLAGAAGIVADLKKAGVI